MTTLATRRERRHQQDADAARRPGRRAGGVLVNVLLWIAAIAGVICIVLTVLAFTAHITLIMFRTGSMAPTIPTGSVAVVQRIPASDIRVGDVVTVDRTAELPITHRVVSVAVGRASAERIVVLKGDANAQADPSPYTVSSVRIVRFSVPGLAPVIVALGNPFVLGGITAGVALLVGWAFWPRSPRARHSDADVGEPG
jgi:signal peptidase